MSQKRLKGAQKVEMRQKHKMWKLEGGKKQK